MKKTIHGQYLIKLTRIGVINCYLVREEDGLTLIDAGLPGSADQIIAAAREEKSPIKRISISHAHGDHTGSLEALCAKLPDVELVWGTRTAHFFSGEQALLDDEPQVKLRGGYTKTDIQATRLLQAEDMMIGSLKAIPSPGHTPDHMVFFDTRDGTLIAGDAFQTQGGIAVAGTIKPLFPFPSLATWHKPTALATAQKLHNLQPTRLAVGHGKVIEEPSNAMAQAIEQAS